MWSSTDEMMPATAAATRRGASFFAVTVIFRLFENALDPTQQPARPEPPAGLIAFYWHFARQAKGLFVALFAVGFLVATLDSMIPVFMGRVVSLVTASDPARFVGRVVANPAWDGCGAAHRAPARADGPEPRRQPGDFSQCLQL